MANKSGKKISKQINADLCVVGGAGAGLTAAARAKECGVERVILLEKMPRLGGCSKVSFCMLGVNTPLQKRLGIEVDISKVFHDHMQTQQWDCNGKLVSRWLHNTSRIFEWLEDIGAEYDQLSYSAKMGDPTMQLTHRITKGSIGSGLALVRVLTKRCKELGVEIMLDTRGEKLITNGDGAVTGICASSGDELIEIRAKNVVLATGSISNNRDMIERMVDPRFVEGASRIEAALKHNTGDGQRMAEEVGVRRGHIATLYFGPHQHPYSNDVCTLLRRTNLMRVNKHGIRYSNENILNDYDGYLWMNGNALNHQPDKLCYTIVDQAMLDEIRANHCFTAVTDVLNPGESGNYTSSYESDEAEKVDYLNTFAWMDRLPQKLKSEAEAGRVLIANTWDEIAEWIGAKTEVLKSEIERYNHFCAEGKDADFYKDPGFLSPVSTPPYYVIKAWQGIDTLIGGITINHKFQALDKNYEPVPGLYGAGVVCSGFLGSFYSFPGTEMSFTTTSGYLVGEEVAGKSEY